MTTSSIGHIRDLQQQYVLGTYTPELLLVRGEMSWVWDADGNRYLDFATGISVCNLGHCHPRVTEAVCNQAGQLLHVSNLFYNENQPRLAEQIARHSFDGKLFFCNSGAEANEGMIKLARRWGNPTGRHDIICMQNSFHGRTLATLAATGREKYRRGFEPDTPGFTHVAFNDLEALRKAVTPRTAAVLLEPVQGEGGVIPAETEYLRAVRDLCDECNLMLLVDEVQCGMGRSGRCFAYQHYDIVPDAMAMAKSLGNGVPIGAFEVRDDYAAVLSPGTHASTFGGNPMACAAGLAVWSVFDQENVLQNCRDRSDELFARMRELQKEGAPIREVRGLGLMVGIELDVPVTDVIKKTRKDGLLTLPAGENVLRLLPPLTISREELTYGLDIICSALHSL